MSNYYPNDDNAILEINLKALSQNYKNLKNKLDTNNLNDIKKKFSYERISTEYMDIYKNILVNCPP